MSYQNYENSINDSAYSHSMTRPAIPLVAAVVLTYNSDNDLPCCLLGLSKQCDVDLRIIVVDNASDRESLATMQAQFTEIFSSGAILSKNDSLPKQNKHLFICNDQNSGYSAGNNIGARVASSLGCTSIIIINPDVQIDNNKYVKRLNEVLNFDDSIVVACSNVINLNRENENPMKELSFTEEALWPIYMVGSVIKKNIKSSIRQHLNTSSPFYVEKVSGACFMIRTDFIKSINYFDESVFLYSEESILMAQVKAAQLKMILAPDIKVIHAHYHEVKGDPLPRYRAWLRSRNYFLKNYTSYGFFKLIVLAVSQKLSLFLFYIRNLGRRF